MAKLPTSLLPRSLPSSTLLTSSSRPTTANTPHAVFAARPCQVRHATEIVRPKRPYTWTQIVQLSDGSTYTTRTTSPLPVYRSTKDTRNHLKWQPSEVSLQNVEVDEAGKLAGFRQRFGTAFDLTPGAALAAKEMKEDAERNAAQAKTAKGKKSSALEEAKIAEEKEKEAAEAAAKEAVAAEDSFESLMASYVREQPNLKGGQVAGKGFNSKNKKKK
ncbi:hypothetical protein N0V93_006539 [Gnomoniopsis smithogilvyi]|uniref:Ribosomal protein bL31m N-terminal domain-containing protein n=1 Tax=Gnomoniopsis smithogilvyi TaxID=1191159 RepID=A0A9W9CVT7_9PEZI|nr:hypothetical protein N0V93_006539 [Gnomoniopsis smithogilvyi]